MAKSAKNFIIFQKGSVSGVLPLNSDSQFFVLGEIIKVPKSPESILGLAYYNGQILTVLNTDFILGTGKTSGASSNSLIFGTNGDHYALPVDKVGDIIKYSGAVSKIKDKKYIKYQKENYLLLEIGDILSLIGIYD